MVLETLGAGSAVPRPLLVLTPMLVTDVLNRSSGGRCSLLHQSQRVHSLQFSPGDQTILVTVRPVSCPWLLPLSGWHMLPAPTPVFSVFQLYLQFVNLSCLFAPQVLCMEGASCNSLCRPLPDSCSQLSKVFPDCFLHSAPVACPLTGEDALLQSLCFMHFARWPSIN